jgi:hypothetical protein
VRCASLEIAPTSCSTRAHGRIQTESFPTRPTDGGPAPPPQLRDRHLVQLGTEVVHATVPLPLRFAIMLDMSERARKLLHDAMDLPGVRARQAGSGPARQLGRRTRVRRGSSVGQRDRAARACAEAPDRGSFSKGKMTGYCRLLVRGAWGLSGCVRDQARPGEIRTVQRSRFSARLARVEINLGRVLSRSGARVRRSKHGDSCAADCLTAGPPAHLRGEIAQPGAGTLVALVH